MTKYENEHFKTLLEDLPPMKRLFVYQQLTSSAHGEDSVFGASLSTPEIVEAYEEWLSGFDPSVIAAFESGAWEVPL